MHLTNTRINTKEHIHTSIYDYIIAHKCHLTGICFTSIWSLPKYIFSFTLSYLFFFDRVDFIENFF